MEHQNIENPLVIWAWQFLKLIIQISIFMAASVNVRLSKMLGIHFRKIRYPMVINQRQLQLPCKLWLLWKLWRPMAIAKRGNLIIVATTKKIVSSNFILIDVLAPLALAGAGQFFFRISVTNNFASKCATILPKCAQESATAIFKFFFDPLNNFYCIFMHQFFFQMSKFSL